MSVEERTLLARAVSKSLVDPWLGLLREALAMFLLMKSFCSWDLWSVARGEILLRAGRGGFLPSLQLLLSLSLAGKQQTTRTELVWVE